MAQRSADEITQRIRRPHIISRASSVIVDPALEAHGTSRILVADRPTRRLSEHEVSELVGDLAEDNGARLAHTVRRTPASGTPTVPMPFAAELATTTALTAPLLQPTGDLAANSLALAIGTGKMQAFTATAKSPSRWRDVAIGFAIGVGMIGAALIGVFA